MHELLDHNKSSKELRRLFRVEPTVALKGFSILVFHVKHLQGYGMNAFFDVKQKKRM